MTEKIAWFEEVLRLEPNSKLFFPLARAYMQEQRPQDAVAVLRKGLAYHPEHLDARLLLIECLGRHDLAPKSHPEEEQDAPAALTTLITSLTSHSHFWRQWAARCRIEGRADLAVTLDMLAIQLSGGPISWGTLLEQGLRAMTGQQAAVQGTSPADTSAEDTPGRPFESQAGESATKASLEKAEGIPEDISGRVPEGDTGPLPGHVPDEVPGPLAGSHSDPIQETQPSYPQHHVPPPGGDLPPEMHQITTTEDDAQGLENVTTEGERRYYETKTYADLLAKQGELEEAQELYGKLLQTSLDDQQREDLRTRVQEIQERLVKSTREADYPAKESADADIQLMAPESAPAPAVAASDAVEPAPTSSTPKAASKTATTKKTLKKLAERLESRARG